MVCSWSSAFRIFVRYVDPFRRYSWSNSKVVQIVPNFERFLSSKLCWGQPFQNLCSRYAYHPRLERALLVKFREVTPTTPKVIGALMLIFKTNFKCAPLKFFGEPQLGLWCAQASLGESTGRVSKFQVQHPLRAEICSLLKKSIWLGPNSRCPTFWIVDQCLPDLFLRTR